MQFTKAFLAALSAAAAQAVIITNADFSNIAVGTPFVITYSDAVGPVTVYLGTGSPANVVQGAAVGSATGATGSITWTPASGGSYALKIVDAGAPTSPTNPNFSGFFNVAGPVLSQTTTGATSSMMTTTTGMMSTTSAVTTVTTTPMSAMNSTTLLMSTTTASRASNGTTTMRPSTTGSSSGSSSSSTTIPTQVPNSMAAGFASPLAFVFVAVGALLTLN